MSVCDIGVVGLGVMGLNLARNMAGKGFRVAGLDVDAGKRAAFDAGDGLTACADADVFIATLKTPRRIMMMVPAGKAVDDVIDQLLPKLQPGDIIIDGGNSHFADTTRRVKRLEAEGFRFIGMGVSGGEEGALRGPSMMPGGSHEAWEHVQPIFQSMAAKVADGTPCCAYIGPEGAGHFVKMVHNGIEYADMQLIGEAYTLLQRALGMTPPALAATFKSWNEGDLDSYLIAITSRIFEHKDEATGSFTVDMILDTAGQKGTGKWTSQVALDLGVPAPTIAEAVFARCLSAMKEERVAASGALQKPEATFQGDREAFISAIRDALFASKICAYAQGFALIQAASDEYGWTLKPGEIAMVWREGCIIRARFLSRIKEAYDRQPALPNLMMDPYFAEALGAAQEGWRRVLMEATRLGIPAPAFSSALAYYDGYSSARLPANLLQAQRDYFGAHTYERVDQPRGTFFHTQWTAE